jgi:polar amino acid transport system substrate-binding protein
MGFKRDCWIPECKQILLAVLLSGWCLAAAARAESVKSLLLATSEDFAPYVYVNHDGELSGIDYDIVRELCRRLNIQLKVMLLPRLRITKMLKQGELDGVVSTTSYNDVTELQKMWTSEPLYSSSVAIFSLKDASVDALKGTYDNNQFTVEGGSRVGMLDAFDYSLMGETSLSNIRQNAVTVRTDAQLVNLLLFERIAYAVTEDISFSYQARKLGKFDKVANIAEVYSRPVRIALNNSVINRQPGLEDDINRTIGAMIDDDYVANVIYQHLRLK